MTKTVVMTKTHANGDIPEVVQNSLEELLGVGPLAVSSEGVDYRANSLSTSYEKRVEAIYQAAQRLARVLENNANKQLKDHIELFKNYIIQLRVEHLEYQGKPELEISDRQKKYMELMHLLELAVAEQLIPYAEKQLPHGNKNPKKVAAKLIAKADEYQLATTLKPILVTSIKEGGKHVVQADIPLPPISELMAEEILSAKNAATELKPTWYKAMSVEEKLFFDDMVDGVEDAKDVINKIHSLSSMTRTIPGVANFSRHIIAVLDENGNMLSKEERLRSSHVASRDYLKLKMKDVVSYAKQGPRQPWREDQERQSKKVQLRLESTVKNVEKIIEEFVANKYAGKGELTEADINVLKDLPILVQTLVSPLAINIMKKPDVDLFKDKTRAIDYLRANGCRIYFKGKFHHIKFDNIIDTNHPLNFARHLIGTGSIFEYEPTINKKSIKKLIELAALSDRSSIKEAAKDLEDHYALKVKGLDHNRYELHCAALEEFIVTGLGGMSYGSCVSGKDRKGIEILYADAMSIYYTLEGSLPKFNEMDDKKRSKFVDILADLYISHHQQINAGQNAPGADGIKTPADYLPLDVQERIIEKTGNKNIFNESNKIAGNNDNVKQLKKAKKFFKELKNKLKGKALLSDEVMSAYQLAFKPKKMNDIDEIVSSNDYVKIVDALKSMRDRIAYDCKDKAVLREIDRRITLLENRRIDVVRDSVDKFGDLILVLPPKVRNAVEKIDSELSTEYFRLTEAAVNIIKVERDLARAATPPLVVAKVIKREALEADLNGNGLFKAAPYGMITGGDLLEKGAPTIPPGANNVRVCEIDCAAGRMVYVETDKNGQVISTNNLLPDKYIPNKAWEAVYHQFIAQYKIDAAQYPISEFKRLITKVSREGDKTLEKNLAKYLPSIEGVDMKAVAKSLADHYMNVMYENKVGKMRLPSNDLIILAMSQIDGLREHQPVRLKTPVSEAHAKACLLYAAVQGGADKGYDVRLGSQYQYLLPLDKSEIKAFRNLLQTRPELGFVDRASLTETITALSRPLA